MDAAAWNDRYAAAEFVWSTEPNQFLAAEVAGLTAGSALDLACGEGRNAVWLATLGWDATGVDFSDVGLAKAAKLAEANEVTAKTRWVCADATSWVPDEQFDLVAVAYLHLSEPLRRAAMSVAVAALAPGGTLVVIGHDATNITEGVGGPPDPAVLYGPDDIVGDLHSADLALVVERAERVLRAVRVETDGVAEERHAIDCLVRVCRP
jgi:SAM-dependent methyltransferase